MDQDLQTYITTMFGVDTSVFLNAMKESPGSRGSIIGAISETILKNHLEENGYETLRIVEKPAGGFDAKNPEARGDFYIRKTGSSSDEWLVIESKGLKSNAEFNRSQLESKKKVFKFLKKRVFPKDDYLEKKFATGHKTYNKVKAAWEAKNHGKNFPPFGWNRLNPGSESYNLTGIWENEKNLNDWVDGFEEKDFTEKAYRAIKGPVVILDTHAPSQRTSLFTGKKQTGPLVSDFNIMAVDLFLRTGKHEFAFMNSSAISHSPGSPEHLYQNYTIDILVKGLKDDVVLSEPWYKDIEECIDKTRPVTRKIDKSQLDMR